MYSKFIDPITKMPLEFDAEGNLSSKEDHQRKIYLCHEGCCDFTVANTGIKNTKGVYDEFYGSSQLPRLSLDAINKPWFDPIIPWRRTHLDSMGPLTGKRILLLGNGESYRELYFLLQGASVVYTDLSVMAVRRAQSIFRRSELWEKYRDQIEFHAVDGMHMPFSDASFDIIFGTKVVGFIDDREAFFSEVSRCLKPDGICRFFDDAYSPAWDMMRRLWCPIKVHILWKRMSDLERVRHGGTPLGTFGFKQEELVPLVKQCGFSKLVFIREYFFLRIAQFCWAGVFGWDPGRLRFVTPFLHVMKWADNLCSNTAWMKRNSLPLVFGFDK